MRDWIRKALTRKIVRTHIHGKRDSEIIEPDERLVYAVKFAIGMTICLTGLEIAHMAFLHAWNSEIFIGISSLITFVSGIIVGQKAS